MKREYEDAPEYSAPAYAVDGWRGIAWYVRGWEVTPDEDTEWSGVLNRTGQLILTMVGDDRHFAVDPASVRKLRRNQYCGNCGQRWCGHGRST